MSETPKGHPMASWGPDEEGNIRARAVEGWQMLPAIGVCLVRLRTEPDEAGQKSGAQNLVLSREQCEEIGKALLRSAEILRSEGGSA